ncbi:hypothetical protein HY375_00535 [Candidatus Berkelbacteria bacterium]|nr:hypothetical protein [Candidatus Berkelbacteria bacterium]
MDTIYSHDPKRFLLNLAYEPGGFAIETSQPVGPDWEVPPAPGQLLFELWDIGVKFGGRAPGGLLFQSDQFVGPSPTVISVAVHERPLWERRGGLCVIRWSREPLYTTLASLTFLRNCVPLFWEKDLPVDLVQHEVERINAKARSLGLMNAEGERRLISLVNPWLN